MTTLKDEHQRLIDIRRQIIKLVKEMNIVVETIVSLENDRSAPARAYAKKLWTKYIIQDIIFNM